MIIDFFGGNGQSNTSVTLWLAISCVLWIKKKHPSTLSILLLSFATRILSSSARSFWTCKMQKKMQEGGEERKDSSEGMWLTSIWKYCFTSSELNYWSELAVLWEQAQSHCSPDGQEVAGGSVAVTMVCTWTSIFWGALLSCGTSEVHRCFCWTKFHTQGQCPRVLKLFHGLSLPCFLLP